MFKKSYKLLFILIIIILSLFLFKTNCYAIDGISDVIYPNDNGSLLGKDFFDTCFNNFNNLSYVNGRLKNYFVCFFEFSRDLKDKDYRFIMVAYDSDDSVIYNGTSFNFPDDTTYIYGSKRYYNESGKYYGGTSLTIPDSSDFNNLDLLDFNNNLSVTVYGFTNNVILQNFTTNYNVLNTAGDIITNIVPAPNYPYITNSEQILSTGNFDYLCINSADFVGDNWQDFYLLAYDYSTETSDSLSIYPKKEICISGGKTNAYFTNEYDGSYIFMIPSSNLGLDFKNGNNYAFKLAVKNSSGAFEYIYEQNFTVGEITPEQQQQNSQDRINSSLEEQNKKIDEQTSAIKENTETNKSIFGKIGEVLSFINPLSENFFAYKLLDLLYAGLKALFIPSDEFFQEWFTDLNDTFSDQFGILYYPVSVIIDFLGKLEPNLTERDPVINVPDLTIDLFGNKYILISATSYNLNSLLQNEKFATLHNYYLFFVNVVLVIGLIFFANKIAVQIFGGIDNTATDIYDNYESDKVQKRPLGYRRGFKR